MKSTESDKFEQIERIVLRDLGNRKFPAFYRKGLYRKAAESLLKAESVWLTSGFWILSANAIETDGPPGVAVLAVALDRLGIPVRVLTDRGTRGVFEALFKRFPFSGEISDILSFSPDALALSDYPSHFVALERPGKSSDGLYYNFRGLSITDFTDDADSLFEAARAVGTVTVGIGDGGNELGMGNYRERVEKEISADRPFAAVVASDYPLCAGVSNWGGYALAGMLSLLTGKTLMPKPEEIQELICFCNELGCVDGVTGRRDPTVDGLDYYVDPSVAEEIRKVVES